VVSVLRARAGTPDRAPRDPDGRMPLAEHLRELRGRLSKALLAIAITAVVGLVWYDQIISFLMEPACDIPGISGVGEGRCSVLTNKGLLGPFSLALKVALLSGLVLSSPVWMYQLWAFVAPGLHRREKRWTLSFVALGVPFFLIGAAAAYYTLPRGIPILLGLTPNGVSNDVDLAEYLDVVIRLILVFGLAFELPVLLVLLNLAGVLSAARLRSWWRIAFMVIFIFAAVATPTGDPITMLLLAIPLCGLYLGAIVIATFVDRRRSEDEELFPDLADDEASPLGPDVAPVDRPEPVEHAEPVDDQAPDSEHPGDDEAPDDGRRLDDRDDVT